jgi:hypothetical protein
MVRLRIEGRFFGPRINCERVPLLPACVVRRIIDEPRWGRFLLTWQSPFDGAIEEVALVKRVALPTWVTNIEAIEVRRSEQSCTDIHIFRKSLPRNGGTDIFLECPGCSRLRRGLYGWTAGGATTCSVCLSQWQCRECAGLRYASEGGALLVRSRGLLGKMLGVARAKRPQPWLPYMLPALDAATES